jgi:tyrosine-protein kinase Etk/Wzc
MEKAIAPEPPPLNLLQMMAFSLFIGLLFSLGPVVLYDKNAKTARTVLEFKQLSNKHVLESIPIIPHNQIVSSQAVVTLPERAKQHVHLITESTSKNHYYINEILRALRTKIMMTLHGEQDKSIVITSMERGVGKTTIACNLASVMAQINLRVILIDGDMRCGGVHNFFGCPKENGLQELLSSEKNINEAIINKYIKTTTIPNLSIIASGNMINNPSELLSSIQLIETKRILSSMFDVVIMDCPPLGAVTDAAVVHEQFSNYCIIAKAGSTNINDLTRKLKEYPLVEKKVIGIILNFSALDKNISYYKNTKYYT